MDIETLMKRDVGPAHHKSPVDIMRKAVYYAAKALGYKLGVWVTNSRHKKRQSVTTTYAIYQGERPARVWHCIEDSKLFGGSRFHKDARNKIIMAATYSNFPGSGKTPRSMEYKALERLYNALEKEL